MSSWGAEWLFDDHSGRTWRVWLASPGEPRRESALDEFAARKVVDSILFFGLSDTDPHGLYRLHGPVATVFSIYDALSLRRLSEPLTTSRHAWELSEYHQEVVDTISNALRAGTLRMEERARPFVPPLGEPPPEPEIPRLVEPTAWFELRVVDEAGEPIPGLDMTFSISGDRRSATTNGAGIAHIDGFSASFGTASLPNPAKIRKILEPRWETFRPVRIPKGNDVTVQALRDLLPALRLESETPRTVVLAPHHRRVRLVGMHFDTNKSFLLPSAMRGIRQVKELYGETQKTEILVVGHTDARGKQQYNEQLSLERAEAIVAFMKDDIDAWHQWFSTEAPEKRWGDREVTAMLSVLPEGETPFTANSPNAARDPETIKRFQRWSNETRGTSLDDDGKAGPATKRALVAAYMALDHTSLPRSAKIVAHGCGPHQPLPASDDGQPAADAKLRRVDIFAFEGRIRPPAPGPTSGRGAPEYPQWVAQMTSTIDVEAEDRTTLRIWLKDRNRQRMPNTPYRLTFAGEVRTGAANDEGLLEEDFVTMDDRCVLEWGELPPDFPKDDSERFRYQAELFATTHPELPNRRDREFHNLAYDHLADDAQRIAAFESDYDRPNTEITNVHQNGLPAPKQS